MNHDNLAVTIIPGCSFDATNDPIYDYAAQSVLWKFDVLERRISLLVQNLLISNPSKQKANDLCGKYRELLVNLTETQNKGAGIWMNLFELEMDLLDSFPQLKETMDQVHSLIFDGV